MGLVGRQVDGLPNLQREVVEEENGEEADVRRVLLFGAEDKEFLWGEGAGLRLGRVEICEWVGKATLDARGLKGS